MNYDVLRSLLTAQLLTVTGLPLLQAENTRITPVAGQPWCRLSLLPAEPTALSVGPNGMNEHQGLAQVDLFYGQDLGTADANAMAALVMAALPRGFMAANGPVNVHIRSCYQQAAYQLERWYVVPVVARWSSFSST